MKKMSKRLRNALSIDDELYARYKYQCVDIDRRERALYRRCSVSEVILKQKDRFYRCQIISFDVGENGTRILVSK